MEGDEVLYLLVFFLFIKDTIVEPRLGLILVEDFVILFFLGLESKALELFVHRINPWI